MHSKQKGNHYYSILANLIVPLGGLGTDIYLPSFPAMANEFGVSHSKVQLTMTAYVLAMGISQLFAGPISDAWGRKKQIIIAVLIQLAAMTAIICAQTITQIMIARFIQGLGAAFMIVPARAILNDRYSGSELKKKFNYSTISFALAPIIAPFIGGYCEYYIGWRACFFFIMAYAMFLLLLVTFTFEETLTKKSRFHLSHMWHNYKTILSNRLFLMSTLLLCVMFGYTSLTNVLGPFIFQTQLHFSALTYGYIALFFGLAWLTGNVTSRFLLHVPMIRKVQLILSIHALITLSFLCLSFFSVYNAAVTIACIIVLIFTTGIIFPLFVGEALSLFPTLAASSNACLFSFTWIAFALYTLCATILPVTTLMPLSVAFTLITLASYAVYVALKRLNLDPPK